MTLTLENKAQIIELCARYVLAVDTNDIDTWLSTWTDDGVLDAGFGTAQGKTALRELEIKLEGGMSKGKRHLSVNHVVEGDDSTASATSYLVVLEREGHPAVVTTAVFTDTLKKVDGVWKFTRRHLAIDPSWQQSQSSQ